MSLFSRSSPLTSSPPALPFSYRIVRSARRRSVSIEISQAEVVVRAPHFVAIADIERFARQKAPWVVQKLAQQSQQMAAVPERQYVTGGKFPFLGEILELRIQYQVQADVFQRGGELFVDLSRRSRLSDEEQARRLVSQWYQRQALLMLTAKTQSITRAHGLTCKEVTIKETRSKWGHCTAQGVIQYNWKILLAPEPIVDYLVAHEVSHLRHHNHSPEFWQLVARICPDFKKHRAWLKVHGMQLVL